MGWVTRSENVCFETWRIAVVLLDASAAVEDGIASASAAQQRLQDKTAAHRSANDQVSSSIMKVIEVSVRNASVVPSGAVCFCGAKQRPFTQP
jgi:hypothetical protein